MRCKICLKKENLYMCFFADENKQVYLCSKCLGKTLLEDPFPIYNMSKLAYTWKQKEIHQTKEN
ncbi:MAG: hypothetical protein ACW98D_08975 [Promethearchaeota archaeon]